MKNFLAHCKRHKSKRLESMIFLLSARHWTDVAGRITDVESLSLCCALEVSDIEVQKYKYVAANFGTILFTCLWKLVLIDISGINDLVLLPAMPTILPSRPVYPLPHQIELDKLPWK